MQSRMTDTETYRVCEESIFICRYIPTPDGGHETWSVIEWIDGVDIDEQYDGNVNEEEDGVESIERACKRHDS